MLRKILFFLFFFLLSLTLKSQIIFEENFDYATGDLYSVSDNLWVKAPTTGASVFVVDGNLSYNGYSSSDIGKMIFLNASGTTTLKCGAVRSFTPANSNTIYCSFLMNVISTNDMDGDESDGDYFCNWGSTSKSYIMIKKGSDNSRFLIGLKKTNQGNITWYGTELDIGTTHLMVMSYTFKSGEDPIKLWINPLLNDSEPTPDITMSSGTDNTEISTIQFRQNTKSGDIYIDGLRVATSWSYAPLPVELISFTAREENGYIKLNWQTATETNNYGFEIERLAETHSNNWEKIGFIHGNGNCFSPKNYTFIDMNPLDGELLYRLKQIDLDGSYEYYSTIVKVNYNITELKENDLPDEFHLYQNYPNPFNPITLIRYAIPGINKQSNTSYNVSLKVYCMLGREIVELVNQPQSPGIYQVEFDGSKLSSGIYMFVLQCGHNKIIKKSILMK